MAWLPEDVAQYTGLANTPAKRAYWCSVANRAVKTRGRLQAIKLANRALWVRQCRRSIKRHARALEPIQGQLI